MSLDAPPSVDLDLDTEGLDDDAPEEDYAPEDDEPVAVADYLPTSDYDPWRGVKVAPKPKRGANWNKAQAANKARTQRNRDEIVLRVSEGQTIKQAVAELGLHTKTYDYYRKVDPAFRLAIDRAKHNARTAIKPEDAEKDFAAFRKVFFGFDTFPHHEEIIRQIERPPDASGAVAIRMVLVPPAHGKSTLMEDYIGYRVALDPNVRILVLSQSQRHARKLLRRIKKRMLPDPSHPQGIRQYLERFGPFYSEGQEKEGKPWTNDFIVCAQANHDERDYTIEALGWNGQIYGGRYDLIICDDVQTRGNLNLTETIIDKFQMDVVSRPDEAGGIIMWVGTRIETGDCAETLQVREVVDPEDVVELPVVDAEGNPLWPERFSVERLKKLRKQVGEKAWWTAYMMRPQAATDATFTQPVVEKSYAWGVTSASPATAGKAVGLDPALGGGNALVACSYTYERLTVHDTVVDYGLARTEQILTRIEEFAARYHPNAVIIENAAFQRGLARDERLEALGMRYGFRTREHETAGHKADAVLGVASMAGAFMRGEIQIAWGDDYSRVRNEQLVKELLAWRPTIPTKLLRQDAVMALWFVWKWWMETRGSINVDTSAWNFTAAPWANRRTA